MVSLLEKAEAAQLELADEGNAAEANGIRFISLPIPDRGVPASTPAAVSLITGIASALEEGKNVAVHCRQGVGRSGLIVAGVLMTSGISPERALEVVSSARGQAIPETPGQRLWVYRLPSALRHIPAAPFCRRHLTRHSSKVTVQNKSAQTRFGLHLLANPRNQL